MEMVFANLAVTTPFTVTVSFSAFVRASAMEIGVIGAGGSVVPPSPYSTPWNVCAPRLSNVSCGVDDHSIAGSKASLPSLSPFVTVSLRMSDWSAVATVVPHFVPGSMPF
jgi:hypothetical protein